MGDKEEKVEGAQGVQVTNKKGVLSIRIPDKTVLALLTALGTLVYGRVEQHYADASQAEVVVAQEEVVKESEALKTAQGTVYKLMASRLEEAFDRIESCETDLDEMYEFIERKHRGRPVRVSRNPTELLGLISEPGKDPEPEPDSPTVTSSPEMEDMEGELKYGKAGLPDFDQVMQQKVSPQFLNKNAKQLRKSRKRK